MFYIGLFSVDSLKLLLFSIISYFIYVYILKPALHFVHIVIHYHGFDYYPKNFLLGHLLELVPNNPFPLTIEKISKSLTDLTLKMIGHNPGQSLQIIWFSIFPVVFALGHEAVEVVLHKENLKKTIVYKFMGLGDGLATSEPELWKVRRKLIEPFFATKKMKDHAKHMYEEVESFSHQLNSQVGKPIDLVNQIHTSTLNIILKSTASIPLDDSMEDKEKIVEIVAKMEKNTVERVINPLYQLDWTFKLCKFSQVYYETIESMKTIINKIFSRRKQLLESNQAEVHDFVHLIEDKVDQKGLLDEMITFIGAGHETTAVTLRWLLFNLGNHLDVQEKLYQEIIEIFPDDTPLDDMEKMNQCIYLEQCIKESLRLNPPLNGAGRVLEDDIIIKGKRFLKGSNLGVLFLAVHYNPSVYPDPHKYDPDRWSPENASKIPKTAFIAFGYGPRSCIGYRYAMLELKIYTIQVIRKFSLRSTRKHGSIPMLYEITSQPSLPLEIITTPRNNNQLNLYN